jgi:hypothetical protein
MARATALPFTHVLNRKRKKKSNFKEKNSISATLHSQKGDEIYISVHEQGQTLGRGGIRIFIYTYQRVGKLAKLNWRN